MYKKAHFSSPPYTRQIPSEGNPPMAQSATLREQYWLTPHASTRGTRARQWLPYTPSFGEIN